jgi:hypothetical protein
VSRAKKSRSCKVCRLRKVKCDRVRPCHACCAHGYPSKCVYDSIAEDDQRPISQAEEIRALRAETRELRGRIGSQGRNDHYRRSVRHFTDDIYCPGYRNRTLRRLENLFESLRSASLDAVDRIIADIRASQGGLERQVIPVGPWEGKEGRCWQIHMTADFDRDQRTRVSRPARRPRPLAPNGLAASRLNKNPVRMMARRRTSISSPAVPRTRRTAP